MITSYQYLHNQGIAHLQPGYEPPTQGEPTILIAAVSELGNVVFDQAAQRAAEELAYKFIGTAVGATIRVGNFILTIVPLDINPPPAGDYPGDMYIPFESPRELPWENNPCN